MTLVLGSELFASKLRFLEVLDPDARLREAFFAS
jgi:hypothetical protein